MTKINTRYLSNKNTQLADKYMKKRATSLTVSEMQIEATLRSYHINENGYQETVKVGRDVKRRDVYSFDGSVS